MWTGKNVIYFPSRLWQDFILNTCRLTFMIFTDWRRLPAELKPRVRRKTKSSIKPKVKPKVKLSVEDVSKTLEVSKQ